MMCGCDTSPGYICSQCQGTPFDPYYFLDEPDDVTAAEFEKLTAREVDGRWQGWT